MRRGSTSSTWDMAIQVSVIIICNPDTPYPVATVAVDGIYLTSAHTHTDCLFLID
eukprot:m.118397 g.118397  ORF g.118397 m.118397 type:complete len:55 (+) comp12892_c2_seq6:1275-1439(+)